jgi:hypothetical protein
MESLRASCWTWVPSSIVAVDWWCLLKFRKWMQRAKWDEQYSRQNRCFALISLQVRASALCTLPSSSRFASSEMPYHLLRPIGYTRLYCLFESWVFEIWSHKTKSCREWGHWYSAGEVMVRTIITLVTSYHTNTDTFIIGINTKKDWARTLPVFLLVRHYLTKTNSYLLPAVSRIVNSFM